MFGLQSRVVEIERRLRKALQDLADLFARMAAVENQKQSPGAGASGGGGTAGVYFADHLSIAGCTALLSTLPGVSTVTGVSVYQIGGSTVSLVTAAGSVSNGLPDATSSTKRQILARNSDGSFSVIGESCTAV